MIEVKTLGALSVRGADGRELHALLAQPKRVALLVYLCLARPRGFQRRDTLLAMFWPESDELHARAALRKAVHVLRSAIGPDIIVSRGEDELGLDFAAIQCDALNLQELIDQRRWDAAVALYEGDLLAGFHVDETPEFEQWLSRERVRLRASASRAADALVTDLEAEGQLARAIDASRKAVLFGETDERMLRRLMLLLNEAGDKATAVAEYRAFRERIAQFEAVPSAETVEVLERITQPAQPSRKNLAALPALPVPPTNVLGPANASPRRSRRLLVALALGMLAIVAGVIGVTNTGAPQAPTESRRQLTFAGNVTGAASSPDGQFLAFTAMHGDSEVVVIQDLSAGAAPDTVLQRYKVNTIEWSPDGTQLLLAGVRFAAVVPRSGRPVRHLQLPDLMGPGVHAYWLPDGERISLHLPRQRRLLTMNLRTGDTTSWRLSGFDWLVRGAWSPDGRLFAGMAMSAEKEASSIIVADSQGTIDTIASDSVRLSSPRWSPSGGAVFFVKDDGTLWRAALRPGSRRGEKPELVTQLPDMLVPLDGVATVSVSPEGHWTYVKAPRFSNLWSLRRDGARAMTRGTGQRWGTAISPDGRWLAYGRMEGREGDVFRMPVKGGPEERVTFGARMRGRSELAWSPDGREVAFVSSGAGRSAVTVATIEDGRLRHLPNTELESVWARVAWAPASHIAYPTISALHLVSPRGDSNRVLLTDTTNVRYVSLVLSPDGQRLAFMSFGAGQVVVLDLRTGAWKVVAGVRHWPRSWSDDGRYLYTQDYRTIHRVDVRSNDPPERIITFPPGWRNAQCVLVPRSNEEFICNVSDFVSDAWRVDLPKPHQKREKWWQVW